MNRRLLIRFVTSMVLFVPFYLHASGVKIFDVLTNLEAESYDARLLLTLPKSRDERIIIIDIDERTMQQEGQWPWGRDKLANFVNILFDDYHIEVLAFDAIFPEEDGRSTLKVLDQLASNELADIELFKQRLDILRPQFDFDQAFADSLAHRKTVVGFSFSNDDSVRPTNRLGKPVMTRDQHQSNLNIHRGKSFTASLPKFVDAAASSGFINNQSLDSDGSFRRAAIVQEWEGDWYPSLALAVASLALDNPKLDIVFHSGKDSRRDSLDLEWLTLGDHIIPIDERAAVLVPYRDQENSFPIISATDILSKEAGNFQLDGAIVLVGTSAIGLRDMRVTPVSENFSGVEVQASIISGILDGRIKHRPRYVQGIEVVSLLILTVLATWILVRLPLVTASLTMLLLALMVFAVNLQLWIRGNFVVPLASSWALLFMLYLFHMIIGYFGETRGRRQLSARFGEYIPPELVEEMGRNPGEFSMESSSKQMTVMFTDVRGFTGISENLEPRELSQLMNEYLTPMTEVIHRSRGTIDKYIGDAVMAFWGAPLDDERHAGNAVEAAINMVDELKPLNLKFAQNNWPEIRIGIGINSGTMRVGDMGSQFRKAYTVMGDAVNLAARLESLTKIYGIEIAVTEDTVRLASRFQFLEIDRVRVKGKDEVVGIYMPLARIDQVTSKMKQRLALHQSALRAYRSRNWDQAESAFFQLQQSYNEKKLYAIYLDRIAHFRSHAAADDWDGVFVHNEK